MYEIEAIYKGVAPMMQDRFFNIADTATGKGSQSGKLDEMSDELVKKRMYVDSKGVYLPADNVRMMLIGNQMRRGAAMILGADIEKQKGTKYKAMCESCVWVIGPSDPLKIYLEPKRKTYDAIDERSYPTMKGKGGCSRKIKRRPVLTLPWSLSFLIQVTDETIAETLVKTLFEVAGLRCGAGAYGPTFGRCVISKWKVKK